MALSLISLDTRIVTAIVKGADTSVSVVTVPVGTKTNMDTGKVSTVTIRFSLPGYHDGKESVVAYLRGLGAAKRFTITLPRPGISDTMTLAIQVKSEYAGSALADTIEAILKLLNPIAQDKPEKPVSRRAANKGEIHTVEPAPAK